MPAIGQRMLSNCHMFSGLHFGLEVTSGLPKKNHLMKAV